MFSYFKYYFIFFNVNEQQAAIFQIGQGYVFCGLSLFLLFTPDYSSEYSRIYTGLILPIAQNLPCYLHFAFCPSTISPLEVLLEIICNIEGLNGGTLKP